jgi:hypothetical protein
MDKILAISAIQSVLLAIVFPVQHFLSLAKSLAELTGLLQHQSILYQKAVSGSLNFS